MLSSTRVIHSHNRAAYYHLKRGYADVLLLCNIFPDVPIVAVDPDRLLRDVLFTRGVIDSLVDCLTRIPVAASVDHISKVVMDHYRSVGQRQQPSAIAEERNGYLGEAFSLFLTKVHKRYGSRGPHQLEHDGILLEAYAGRYPPAPSLIAWMNSTR